MPARPLTSSAHAFGEQKILFPTTFFPSICWIIDESWRWLVLLLRNSIALGRSHEATNPPTKRTFIICCCVNSGSSRSKTRRRKTKDFNVSKSASVLFFFAEILSDLYRCLWLFFYPKKPEILSMLTVNNISGLRQRCQEWNHVKRGSKVSLRSEPNFTCAAAACGSGSQQDANQLYCLFLICSFLSLLTIVEKLSKKRCGNGLRSIRSTREPANNDDV